VTIALLVSAGSFVAIMPRIEIPVVNPAREGFVGHLDEETLAGCALRDDNRDAATHLGECAECTVRMDGIRAFYEALTSRDSWEGAGDQESAPGCEEELLALAARTQREYVQARAALAPLLANQVTFIRESVASKEEYRTAGAVRVLAEAANAVCEREPVHARNLAAAAVAIADSLPSGEYPLFTIHALRGLAWKERANALRCLHEYDAALEALDHAAWEFKHFGMHAFELATLAYIRSVILTHTGRLDEATRQAAESAAIFSEYGDAARAARARSLQAGLLYDRREHGAAAAIYEELMAFAESKGDGAETARQAYNAAACWIELGDGVRAEGLLNGAKETYRSLGMHAQAVRADWNLGVAARVAGRLDESVKRLRAAKVSCEKLRMADEAANVTLDLIESLLLLGRRDVVSLCTDVMRHYHRAGKVRQARIAAAFLRDAAGAGTISVETVRYVRRFVAALDREPGMVFVPPV
jgi:tetratricopeptide (TPR) repeat protein